MHQRLVRLALALVSLLPVLAAAAPPTLRVDIQHGGDTKTEAIRALRRRISDEVFRRLQADETARSTGLAVAA